MSQLVSAGSKLGCTAGRSSGFCVIIKINTFSPESANVKFRIHARQQRQRAKHVAARRGLLDYVKHAGVLSVTVPDV